MSRRSASERPDEAGDLRVGILGGTFNPRIGHLICAQEARWQLDLGRVLLMPAGRAPHKEIEQDPGAGERLRLCELAAAEVEEDEVSRYEVDKVEPAYTFETLEWLRAEQPDDELVFIAGADQAASLPQWREPERVFRQACFAVADRPGTSRDEVLSAVDFRRGGRTTA